MTPFSHPQHNADPLAQDSHGASVLHSAAAGGNVGVLQRLFDLGASPASLTAAGRTPLHFAAASASGVQACAELLGLGADALAKVCECVVVVVGGCAVSGLCVCLRVCV